MKDPAKRRPLAMARPALSDLPTSPGLCASCRHLELIASKRSVFVFCAASRLTPAAPRYPALPVVSCRWHSDAV